MMPTMVSYVKACAGRVHKAPHCLALLLGSLQSRMHHRHTLNSENSRLGLNAKSQT